MPDDVNTRREELYGEPRAAVGDKELDHHHVHCRAILGTNHL